MQENTICAVVVDAAHEDYKRTGLPSGMCKTGVRGFVVIGDIKGEDEEKTVRIGTNVEGEIPGRVLLVGEGVEFVDIDK